MRLGVSVLEATAASQSVGGLLNALQVLCLLRRSSLRRYLPHLLCLLTTTHYPLLTAYDLLLTVLQLLAISAAISGRVPVVPRVPCNSGWLRPGKMTLAGVADDYVLQLPGTEEGQANPNPNPCRNSNPDPNVDPSPNPNPNPNQVHCHLAPGGAKCALPEVLPAWHRSALFSGVTAEEAPATRANPDPNPYR